MKTEFKSLVIATSLLFVLGFYLSPDAAYSQQEGDKIYLGQLNKIQSKVLNEERIILVYTPTGYDQAETKYPVMYLLDGTYHFHHVTGIVDFLTREGRMSDMIVVAIVNTDRTRDFSPTKDNSNRGTRFETAGGADNFLKFFEQELIPYVSEQYRVKGYRILVGHSFGGLFTVNALLTEPEMFDAYVAISPTFWWDDNYLARKARPFFKKNPDLRKFLYISMGNEGQLMTESADRFTLLLENEAPDGLVWHYEFMGDEDHGSTPHLTIYKALEDLYDGWELPPGLLDSTVAAVHEHFLKLSNRFGYEIDVPEAVLNMMGYTALGREDFDKAIKIFQLNTKKYPNSANVYDSLGEGYEAMGEFVKARENYAIAVEKGEQSGDPNLPIYRQHLKNMQEQLGLQ